MFVGQVDMPGVVFLTLFRFFCGLVMERGALSTERMAMCRLPCAGHCGFELCGSIPGVHSLDQMLIAPIFQIIPPRMVLISYLFFFFLAHRVTGFNKI
jgi:hypothetical protein